MSGKTGGEDWLRAFDLFKSFGPVRALRGASFSAGRGEVVGLLGPNGAGKTTSFYAIAGLVRPDRGQIFLGQREITKDPVHLRARAGLGYLSQEPSIFRRLTVAENLMIALEQRSLSASERRLQLARLLEEQNLKEIADYPGQALSGGQRRRTEIARILASEPSMLLMDEPFAGIDPVSVQVLKEQIRTLSGSGLGILITDHNVRETLDICDRSHILIDGQVVESGSAEYIIQNNEVKDKYLGTDFKL